MSSSPGGKPSSFSWSGWQDGLFPSLADHSSKKLDLLRDYIVLYLRIVCQNVHGKESQPINFVDGFAGGGLYDGGHLGSPLVLLRAVEEAEAIINQGRTKKITLTPTYYFIEKSTDAFACLESTLKEQGYGHEIGKAIKLIRGDFTANAMAVADDIGLHHSRNHVMVNMKKNVPLYLLLFASAHELGQKFWNTAVSGSNPQSIIPGILD